MLQLLKIKNCRIYAVECDALYFSLPKSVSLPLTISDALGDFKVLFSNNIQSFTSLGPKHYNVTYYKDNVLHSVTKLSGVSLKAEINDAKFDANLFKSFLEDFENKLKSHMKFKQQRCILNFKDLSIQKTSYNFSLTNQLCQRRFIIAKNNDIITMPYGFFE